VGQFELSDGLSAQCFIDGVCLNEEPKGVRTYPRQEFLNVLQFLHWSLIKHGSVVGYAVSPRSKAINSIV
jgi:hypothetical protein